MTMTHEQFDALMECIRAIARREAWKAADVDDISDMLADRACEDDLRRLFLSSDAERS
jgi:hypothetical protein